MYPPKVEDDEVRSLIRALTMGERLPSGAAVRAALARRFDSRGGVARIYRLLAAERARRVRATPTPINVGLLEQEIRNLHEELRHAREREEQQQIYWEQKIGGIWKQVQALEPLVQAAAASGTLNEPLRAAVREADIRAGQAEVLLRAFGPRTGRRQSSE